MSSEVTKGGCISGGDVGSRDAVGKIFLGTVTQDIRVCFDFFALEASDDNGEGDVSQRSPDVGGASAGVFTKKGSSGDSCIVGEVCNTRDGPGRASMISTADPSPVDLSEVSIVSCDIALLPVSADIDG